MTTPQPTAEQIESLLEALSALQQQMTEQQQALTAAQADVTIHLQRRQVLEQQVEDYKAMHYRSVKRAEAAEQQVAALTQEQRAIAYRVGEHASIEALLADRDEMTVYLKVEALVQRLETVEQEHKARLAHYREALTKIAVLQHCGDTCAESMVMLAENALKATSPALLAEAAEARLARLRDVMNAHRLTCKTGAPDPDAVLAEGPAPAAKEGKADGD